MGLFKSREEKAVEYVLAVYTKATNMAWEQLPSNREKHGMKPWPDGPSTPEAIRRYMARDHTSSLQMACMRAYKDKGLAPQPEMLDTEYWWMTCRRYGLGEPLAIPNPWRLYDSD